MKKQDNVITGIYKITNSKGKIYIGQSIDFKKREKEYNKMKNCKGQILLYNSLKKYGPKNHIFEIIEECSLEQLNERERYWQEYYNVVGENGLNCRFTKTNDRSGFCSQETKQKMSKSQTNRIITEEHRKNIGKALIGGKRSQETKQKMSQSLKGKKVSEETKQKMSQSQKLWKRKTKQVIQYDTHLNIIQAFSSVKEAAEFFKVHESNIRDAVNGRSKTSNGYVWKYKND
jgi:group I intron endonuclease